MKTKYTILCPVDFSASAENAVKAAANIASRINATITLLHVFNPPLFATDLPVDVESLEIIESREIIESNLNYFQELIKAIDASVLCGKMIVEGIPSDHIVEIANEGKFDLVVMGTKGPTAFELFVFGSETINVLNELQCPLLVIPEHYEFKKPERIVYASDFMEKDIEAIQWMVDLMRSYDPEFIILNVTSKEDPEHQFFRMFETLLKKSVSYPKVIVYQTLGDNIRESIELYDQANGADWLAMMSRKRDGLSNLFDKSMSKEVVAHSHIPVLIFHHQGVHKDLYGDWILKTKAIDYKI